MKKMKQKIKKNWYSNYLIIKEHQYLHKSFLFPEQFQKEEEFLNSIKKISRNLK